MNSFEVVESLSALAHEHRLAIYRLLVQAGPEGMSAGSIANEIGLPASSFTFHVQNLHRARLITQQRVSRQILYAADFAVMNALLGYLTENCCARSGESCGKSGESARPGRARKRSAQDGSKLEEKMMKRFHVHVSVDDLTASIRFYSTLFAAEPAVVKDDYAKWMLDDPRINFAVSSRGRTAGIDHIGIQVDSAPENLRALRGQLEAADSALVEQSETTCCYAKGDKYWVTDPTGIAWETYHTLSDAPMYGEDLIRPTEGSCCGPAVSDGQGASEDSQLQTIVLRMSW